MYTLNHADGIRCAFMCGKKCSFGAASLKGRSTCGPSAPGAVHWWTLRSCGVHWWTLHRPLQEWPLVDHPPHGSTGGLATTGEVHWWILHYEGGIRWRASFSSGGPMGGSSGGRLPSRRSPLVRSIPGTVHWWILHSRGGHWGSLRPKGNHLVDQPFQGKPTCLPFSPAKWLTRHSRGRGGGPLVLWWTLRSRAAL